ncbi:QueT transporter family protein [Listeria sp. SHR_NRA_18]|uniref:QueT transporter family protein n=1 Tax=Listeria sp. SHR_NRA_18 TaxID=2269046 RepID=UPI00051D80CD|nr:QueT transporter family protein [Listeria sp. SHR_NRA_18]KGL39606.1 membrane protein [Listeriaceae bacterium FSL A5-0209]RQW67149.1 QueT transporter family protein [Listeria sp. SHR_NRA_18]
MKIKTLTVNAIVAALYVVVTLVVAPFGFTNIQFRLSEMFNHLIVFDKKYFFGIVVGVLIANFFSPLGWYDWVFGVGQSAISLAIVILLSRYVANVKVRMVLTTLVFSVTMFIIAWELALVLEFPFLYTWLTLAISEFIVLAVGAPIMYYINKRIDFKKIIN